MDFKNLNAYYQKRFFVSKCPNMYFESFYKFPESKQLFLVSYYKQLSADIKCTIIRLKPDFFAQRCRRHGLKSSFNLIIVHFFIRRKYDARHRTGSNEYRKLFESLKATNEKSYYKSLGTNTIYSPQCSLPPWYFSRKVKVIFFLSLSSAIIL